MKLAVSRYECGAGRVFGSPSGAAGFGRVGARVLGRPLPRRAVPYLLRCGGDLVIVIAQSERSCARDDLAHLGAFKRDSLRSVSGESLRWFGRERRHDHSGVAPPADRQRLNPLLLPHCRPHLVDAASA